MKRPSGDSETMFLVNAATSSRNVVLIKCTTEIAKPATEIAKMIKKGRASSSITSTRGQNTTNKPVANLRRSSRQKRPINHREYGSFSDNEDDLVLKRSFRQSTERKSSCAEDKVPPRREGLRPRSAARHLGTTSSESSDKDEDESFSEGDDIDEEAGEEEEEDENENEEEDEREDDDEEGNGRRRYALRTRTEVQRFPPKCAEGLGQRSPSKSFTLQTGGKHNRKGRRVSFRSNKRHRSSRADESDDSLLIDEIVQSQAPPWLRGTTMCGQSWLAGGIDLLGFQNRDMNVSSSQNDQLVGGIPTAGLSHKGGADIQPLHVDEAITFENVGGLYDYVQSLKEIVFFPLLYPKFFQNYGIKPPRGVLLCGPPGTGKTLIARALAASAARTGQKVNFFMRKGADVLSKWVGEAERQLRMLFEEAQRHQPSIIFFDEIDGLAPVRSSKQEQIHNSIVSTLLALMDGLDSLGQVVVIGATNRVDAIDSALRRPGRFDRELTFALPDTGAREEILKIHTKSWKQQANDGLFKELATACVGYCGADLKALCTEAAIGAFRRKYPQVYTSDDPLMVDVNSVQVQRIDFLEAMSTITPAAQRGTVIQSMPLSSIVAPCLENHLNGIMETIARIFPMHKAEGMSKLCVKGTDNLTAFSTLRYGSSYPFVYRPRLLICGKETAGIEHLGPAILHELEKFPVHSLSLPSLLSDMGSRSPEEAIINIFRESRRTTPAVLYLPQIELWWDTAHAQLRAVLLMLLSELPSNLPVLFLSTAKVSQDDLDEQVSNVFGSSIYELDYPRFDDRAKFFCRLIERVKEISEKKYSERNKPAALPILPKAPKQERERSKAELLAQCEEEQHILRRMRMCLREVCNRLLSEKSFNVFHYPVSEDEAPDYHVAVQTPMDVSTLLQHTDSGQYLTRSDFLRALELIPHNAKAYHKDDYNGARIVSKACALRDAAHAMLSQIDKDLVAQCDAIAAQGGPLKLNEMELESTNSNNQQVAQLIYVDEKLNGNQPENDSSRDLEAHVQLTMLNSNDVGEARELFQSGDGQQNGHSGRGHIPMCSGKYISEPKTEESVGMDLDQPMAFAPTSQIEKLKKKFVRRTKGYGVSDLEQLHAVICQQVRSWDDFEDRNWAFQVLKQTIAGVKAKTSSANVDDT